MTPKIVSRSFGQISVDATLKLMIFLLQYMTEKMGGAEGTKLDVDFVDMERVSEGIFLRCPRDRKERLSYDAFLHGSFVTTSREGRLVCSVQRYY